MSVILLSKSALRLKLSRIFCFISLFAFTPVCADEPVDLDIINKIRHEGYNTAAETTVEQSEVTSNGDTKLPLKADKTLSFSVNEATWMSLDVSPQGDQLVIEVLGDLYLLPIEGGQAIPLSTGMHFDSTPRFSPDGSQIAFISDRNGPDDLWVMPANIGDHDKSDTDELEKAQTPFKLTSSTWDTQLSSPTWSPDKS
jgi:hypothetical protein